jgi:hypothetical protein
MPKLLSQLLNKQLANPMLLVVLFVVVALLCAGVAPNGRHVDHAIAKLDKGAALDGDVEVGNVVQDEAHQLLVLRLADPLDEAVGGQLLAEPVGCEAVLGEAEIEHGGDVDVGAAELFLLFDEVAAADEADGDFLAQAHEEGEHFGGGALCEYVLIRNGSSIWA